MLPQRQIPSKMAGSRDLPIDDQTLVAQVKAGQMQSYGELVRRYQDRIFNTCWRICGHLEDARDLTQEAFLKAFENLDSFRHDSGFYTWIFRVATNLSITHRRSAGRKRTYLEEQARMMRTQADGLVRPPESPDVEREPAGQSAGRAAALLQLLDEDHRAVVVLRDLEGFNYQEIGEILGLPAGTVKSRLHRARMTLREAILQSKGK